MIRNIAEVSSKKLPLVQVEFDSCRIKCYCFWSWSCEFSSYYETTSFIR